MATTEEVICATDNGGDRYVVFYMDRLGFPSDKSDATAAEVVEYKGLEVLSRRFTVLGRE